MTAASFLTTVPSLAGHTLYSAGHRVLHTQLANVVVGPIFFNVKAYVAVGDGVADDTAAIQSAIDDAWAAPGGTVYFPVGVYRITAALTTPTNTAGAIRFLGAGRPRTGTGGWSFDPAAAQGATIRQASTTASVFKATLSSGNYRQSYTIENLAIEGNVATGTTGHGLHFQAVGATTAIIVCLRDVSVAGCKENGIFLDGDVFENQFYNVRAVQCGGAGLKAAANAGGLPGETRLYGCTFSENDIGIDLGGGGGFSLHGVSASYNVNEGLKATSVLLRVYELVLEVNGTASGNQATITTCNVTILNGLIVNVKSGSTGNGFSFVGCFAAIITGYVANSSVGGAGYNDFRFDDATSRCIVESYIPDDGTDRYSLGAFGGHAIRRGNSWQTGQSHAQQVFTPTQFADVTIDAVHYDSALIRVTVAAGFNTIKAPTMYGTTTYHQGQRLTLHAWNDTAGACTMGFEALFHLAGAFTNPAAGKTRTITFEWDATRQIWVEMSRAAADIT